VPLSCKSASLDLLLTAFPSLANAEGLVEHSIRQLYNHATRVIPYLNSCVRSDEDLKMAIHRLWEDWIAWASYSCADPYAEVAATMEACLDEPEALLVRL
jgi:hypothetical protein